MFSCVEPTSICGDDVDTDDEDEIDFCGMPSHQIVEIAIRRDFLLLRLQALVDSETLPEAEAAVVAMEREARRDAKLLRFLVRAGTVEIIRGSKLLAEGGEGPSKDVHDTDHTPVLRSKAARALMRKLLPYHKQRQLKELKKQQRWTNFMTGK